MIRPVDGLEIGRQEARVYRVGTFYHPRLKTKVLAYTRRNYNPQWKGCVEYDVLAPSYAEAQRIAIKIRKAEEAGRPEEGE